MFSKVNKTLRMGHRGSAQPAPTQGSGASPPNTEMGAMKHTGTGLSSPSTGKKKKKKHSKTRSPDGLFLYEINRFCLKFIFDGGGKEGQVRERGRRMAESRGRREREEEEDGKGATEKPEKAILLPRVLPLTPPPPALPPPPKVGSTIPLQDCSSGGGACICPSVPYTALKLSVLPKGRGQQRGEEEQNARAPNPGEKGH